MNDVVEVRMNLIPSCIYLLAIFAALCGALAKRRAVFSISMLLAMGTGASIVAGSVEPPPAPSTNGPSVSYSWDTRTSCERQDVRGTLRLGNLEQVEVIAEPDCGPLDRHETRPMPLALALPAAL